MPRRNKKSTAKKPKGSKSGISINIKNIMKQVQNERPAKQDFINLSGKKPMDNLEMGNMSRLQVPAMSYASRPLSQFPSLASLSNVTREFAPPLSQLTSNSAPPLGGGAPIVTPAQDRQNDVLEGFRPSVKVVASNPTPSATSNPFQAQYGTRRYDIPPPVENYLVPAGLPSALLDAYDGKEDPVMDAAQAAVANQLPLLPPGYIGARERLLTALYPEKAKAGRPPKEAGAAKSPYIKKTEKAAIREATARERVASMVAARSPQPGKE